MKKIILVTSTLFAVTTLFANPAKEVNLSFKDGTLKIVVVHPVKDSTTHYIKNITIFIDGKETKVISPKKQSSLEAEIQEVSLPELKQGSTIEVKTRCNKFGDKSGKLKL